MIHEDAYRLLPDGRCIVKSAYEFAKLTKHQLAKDDSVEAYL